jgi:hypothetical protein
MVVAGWKLRGVACHQDYWALGLDHAARKVEMSWQSLSIWGVFRPLHCDSGSGIVEDVLNIFLRHTCDPGCIVHPTYRCRKRETRHAVAWDNNVSIIIIIDVMIVRMSFTECKNLIDHVEFSRSFLTSASQLLSISYVAGHLKLCYAYNVDFNYTLVLEIIIPAASSIHLRPFYQWNRILSCLLKKDTTSWPS